MTMRALRALRFTGKLVQFTATSRTSMRHVTGQNKQRYVDLEEGFDLDVTYILPGMPKTATTMIAMSVPATGYRSLFRNPLSEVVRLLELKHAKTGYTIMNCCPELPYPATAFLHGTVHLFDIQDHTPPTSAYRTRARASWMASAPSRWRAAPLPLAESSYHPHPRSDATDATGSSRLPPQWRSLWSLRA